MKLPGPPAKRRDPRLPREGSTRRYRPWRCHQPPDDPRQSPERKRRADRHARLGWPPGLPLFSQVFKRLDRRVRPGGAAQAGRSSLRPRQLPSCACRPSARYARWRAPGLELPAAVERRCDADGRPMSKKARRGGKSRRAGHPQDRARPAPSAKVRRRLRRRRSTHRLRLDDAILIKDNHVKAAGSVAEAILACRRGAPRLSVACDVESLAELDEALTAGAHIVLLDNFTRPLACARPSSASAPSTVAAARPVLSEASHGDLKSHPRHRGHGGRPASASAPSPIRRRALDLSLEFLARCLTCAAFQALRRGAWGESLEWHDSDIESTQDAMRDRVRHMGVETGAVIGAEAQSAGRGRWGQGLGRGRRARACSSRWPCPAAHLKGSLEPGSLVLGVRRAAGPSAWPSWARKALALRWPMT